MLLFTGIASLIYENKANDVCKNFYEDKDKFDFSDNPDNSIKSREIQMK